MDIETAISNFLGELRKMGLDSSGALLIQMQINGMNHIMSYGNLNNLAAPARTIGKKGNSLVRFMEKEIQIAAVRESTKKTPFGYIEPNQILFAGCKSPGNVK